MNYKPIHRISIPRGGRQRGSVLFASLGFVFILALLGTAILSATMQGLHLTRHQRDRAQAFNIAESGAELAARWLKDQPYPPFGTSPIDPFGGPQALGEGHYEVVIIPDPKSSGSTLKTFTIFSTGTIGRRTEEVELVVREQSFGKYAYFTDKEVSSVSGGPIWFMWSDKIRGPAHSNNRDGSDFRVAWGNGQGPIFEDMVTSSGSTINYSPHRPTTEPEFLQIYRTGSRGYQLDVDEVPLPSSSDLQRDAAWGSSSGHPTSNGVYVPPSGGIYVRGTSNINLAVDSGGNQVFEITQGTTTTRVTIDVVNHVRRVQVNSGPVTTVPSAGTGVLYSTSNIESLQGTVADNRLSGGPEPEIIGRNSYTIATDVNANRYVRLTNNLGYQSRPDPQLPITDPVNLRPGMLGIIARDIRIWSNAPRDLWIDALLMAGSESTSNGSFYVENYASKPTGTLHTMGGIIQKARGPVGTFSSNGLASGYAKDYWYDKRLADTPPPFFPTTGLYDKVSWRRLATAN
jgi:hypothetical protein